MNIVVIGPNLMKQNLGQFHVHAAGCADIRRDPRNFGYVWAEPHMEFECSSLQEVVDAVYSDIIGENAGDAHWSDWKAYLEEFHFAPCALDLPMEVAE